tara:strand:- start:613 stop:816 length:204 start_codon:yes stop_codon:yes gene_type:complete
MAKKHKKKVYNTPKKLKHIHKNVSVDNFIKSLENPRCNECCSILAIHNNRNYCGKCKTDEKLKIEQK